jgi:hypothetical protein
MLQLTAAGFVILMSQVATSNPGRGGRRKRPLLFTEHGALMVTTVLNSRRDAGAQDERLRALEDAHIGEAIRMQKALGLRCATDGEFRSVAVSWVRRNAARFSEDFMFPLAAEE